jgi:CheY-like chemotaxis protein
MCAAAYPALQKAAFLCIDNNEDLLECEKSFLESFGYTVLTAANGGKGLELASEYPVDAVILDYLMPENESLRCKDRLIGSEYE